MPPMNSSSSSIPASRIQMREKKLQKKKSCSSPRSPLKVRDLNAAASSSCSSSSSSSAVTATSISSEAPRGCLSFLLSHSSSTVAKNGSIRPKSVVPKTPKSAPNVKNSRLNGNQTVKKLNSSRNPEKPTSKRVDRLRKKPPQSSRSGVCGKIPSGLELKLGDNGGNFTPVAKLGSGSISEKFDRFNKGLKLGDEDANCSDSSSPVPPIQASVSPEIQGGGSTSVIVAATPNTCYGAGHVLSGVTDKRKCRARGILTVGDNDLFGSSKIKVFDDRDEKYKLNEEVKAPRFSLVPSPTEASIHWVSSPYEKKDDDEKDVGGRSGFRLNQCELSRAMACSSSLSSSLGFSSELFNRSDSTFTTSDATTVTLSSGRSVGCVLSPELTSKFRGLCGPSFDNLVCSPPVSSPVSKSIFEDRFDQSRGITSPSEDDSMGSGNVVRTPRSNSISPSFGMLGLSRDEISGLWFERELDAVGEVLGGLSLSPEIPTVDSFKMSFEFNPPMNNTSSIDFNLARVDIDTGSPIGVPESSKEELAGHSSQNEEPDYCRCFSDEEEDANNRVDPYECHFISELDIIASAKFISFTNDPQKKLQHQDSIKGRDESFSVV